MTQSFDSPIIDYIKKVDGLNWKVYNVIKCTSLQKLKHYLIPIDIIFCTGKKLLIAEVKKVINRWKEKE